MSGAHLGDVVVTRRNDRHLLTTDRCIRSATGRPGPSTGVSADGSLTVTQRGTRHRRPAGRLRPTARPARLRRHRARLPVRHRHHLHRPGHARRRPGVACTSPPPAAATATSCASSPTAHDVAEARDVLEASSPLDRADIPAVTQRRTLAQTEQRRAEALASPTPPVRPSGPTPQHRCPVPAWFDQLLDDTRRQAAVIERANRERRGARPATHRAVEQRAERPTAGQCGDCCARTEYAAASRRRESAEVDRRIAARLLEESGWRGRRHARQRLADCDAAVDVAGSNLDQVKTATRPHRQRYRKALDATKQADGELHRHQLSRMLPPDTSPEPLHQRAAALETWRRWADGEPVPITEVADVTRQLRDDGPSDPPGTCVSSPISSTSSTRDHRSRTERPTSAAAVWSVTQRVARRR